MKLFSIFEAVITPDIYNTGAWSFGYQTWPRIYQIGAYNEEAYEDQKNEQLMNVAIDTVYKIIKPGVDLSDAIRDVSEKVKEGELTNKDQIDTFIRNWKKNRVYENKPIVHYDDFSMSI